MSFFEWLLLLGVVVLLGCIAIAALSGFTYGQCRRDIEAERLAAQVRLQRLAHAAMAQMLAEARMRMAPPHDDLHQSDGRQR